MNIIKVKSIIEKRELVACKLHRLRSGCHEYQTSLAINELLDLEGELAKEYKLTDKQCKAFDAVMLKRYCGHLDIEKLNIIMNNIKSIIV